MDDTHTNNLRTPPPGTPGSGDAGARIEPAEGAAPGVVADEMLAHGLLSYLHADTPEVQGRRVEALVRAMHEEGRAQPARTLRFPIRSARGWMALAASIALVGVMVLVGFPGETSAQAVLQRSIETMRASGERRYEVRLVAPIGKDELPAEPTAVVDTRSPNFMLLRGKSPEGRDVVAGRDAKGDWVIRPDGVVDREHFREPSGAWPRWAMIGDESLFADSVDRVLEEIGKGYDLEKASEATLPNHGDTKFRHITGTKRKTIRMPGGDAIELWIDPSTNVVERLEMRWDQRAGDGPIGQRNGPEGGPGPRGPQGDGPMRPPQRGPGPMGPMPRPRGDRGDGPPPDDFGPDRPLRGPGPEGRGPRGPEGPDEFDGPGPGGPGPRGPDPERRGPRGMRGPNGPGMDGPDGPRPDRGPGGPRPEERRGPPRRLVIDRVGTPQDGFAPAWFSPDAHASK